MQIFKRNMSRDTYAFTYTGKGGTSDWKIDVNYGKMKENDVTETTYYGSGHDQYGGKNSLAVVDWLEHKQLDVKATINTAINERHLLSYGVGYTDERADGTRLRNAPKQWVQRINPWDYDKSLWVPMGGGGGGPPLIPVSIITCLSKMKKASSGIRIVSIMAGLHLFLREQMQRLLKKLRHIYSSWGRMRLEWILLPWG
jgi:hypothetical protein